MVTGKGFNMTMGIHGAQEAVRALNNFKVDLPETMSQALPELGKAMLEEMQFLVPYDTGELHDSLDYHSTKEELFMVATAGHAGYVEFGTWKMEAQPYFYPVLNRATFGTPESFLDAIKNSLDKFYSFAKSIF